MIDLEKCDARPGAEAGRWVDVEDPVAGKARIKVRGEDSERYRAVTLEQRRARLEVFQQTGKLQIPPEARDAEKLEELVALTMDWEGFTIKGEPWPCTEANARELYKGWPQFRDQVFAFVAQRANFYPPSATDSSPSPSTSSG